MANLEFLTGGGFNATSVGWNLAVSLSSRVAVFVGDMTFSHWSKYT